MILFRLFLLARRLHTLGVSLRVDESGSLRFSPASILTPEDVASLRAHKEEILSLAPRAGEAGLLDYILQRRGWLHYPLTSSVYVAPGAEYPGVQDVPACGDWAASLVRRAVCLSEAPEGVVSLSPLDKITGPDVVAAGRYGGLLLACTVPSIRTYVNLPPDPGDASPASSASRSPASRRKAHTAHREAPGVTPPP